MFSLKVLIHLLAIVAAVVALWGKTNEGRKLTSLGTFLLMVIISSGVLSAYVMYEENQEKQAKEIAVTKAKAKVYTRMLSATEGIKRATLWKPYDPLADRLPPFSYQDGETNLLNPTPKQLSDITARFHDPMKGYTRMLKRYSEDYEAYLTFDNIDSVRDYIRYADLIDFPSIASKYDGSVSFSTLVEQHNVDSIKIEFFLIGLYSMEKSLMESEKKNEQKLVKLMPECKSISTLEGILNCT